MSGTSIVSEIEALTVVFDLKMFRIYLLSSEKFLLATSRQTLRYACQMKDVHIRFARWLDRTAENGFEFFYRPEIENSLAEYLSRHLQHSKLPSIAQPLVPISIHAEATFAKEWQGMQPFLGNVETASVDSEIIPWILQKPRHFLIWDERLSKKTSSELRTVAAIEQKPKIMKFFYNVIAHWNLEIT